MQSPDLLDEDDPVNPESGNGTPPCISCGSPLTAGAVACAACGALVRSRRALSPPAGFFGGALGVFAGPVISFATGFVAYIYIGWTANRTAGIAPWVVGAEYIGIQLVPVLLATALGIRLLRAGRTQAGWFLVMTGIMSLVPAAACDTAVLLHRL